MSNTTKFTGILPALVTPLCEDNKTINTQAVKKVIDMQIEQGADGFYVLGGTGEGIVLDRAQREIMCDAVMSSVAGRKPIINHIAAVNLDEAIDLAKHAERAGCDAIAAIPPVFFAYTEDDMFGYYKKIAESVSIPLIIYYHPSAQKDMSAKLIARIFEIDNVTGVKWSSNNFFELMKLKDMTHGEMNIINGPDELLVSGLAAGADAGIGSTYNFMLPEFVDLYKYFKNGEMDKALAQQLKINRAIDLVIKHGVIPSVKLATSLMGTDVGTPTFPMTQMTAENSQAFVDSLKAIGWQTNGRIL